MRLPADGEGECVSERQDREREGGREERRGEWHSALLAYG
jgi:hypothetical protein